MSSLRYHAKNQKREKEQREVKSLHMSVERYPGKTALVKSLKALESYMIVFNQQAVDVLEHRSGKQER
jgi:hypothetical protein